MVPDASNVLAEAPMQPAIEVPPVMTDATVALA
jgi:hypothetical protein